MKNSAVALLSIALVIALFTPVAADAAATNKVNEVTEYGTAPLLAKQYLPLTSETAKLAAADPAASAAISNFYVTIGMGDDVELILATMRGEQGHVWEINISPRMRFAAYSSGHGGKIVPGPVELHPPDGEENLYGLKVEYRPGIFTYFVAKCGNAAQPFGQPGVDDAEVIRLASISISTIIHAPVTVSISGLPSPALQQPKNPPVCNGITASADRIKVGKSIMFSTIGREGWLYHWGFPGANETTSNSFVSHTFHAKRDSYTVTLIVEEDGLMSSPCSLTLDRKKSKAGWWIGGGAIVVAAAAASGGGGGDNGEPQNVNHNPSCNATSDRTSGEAPFSVNFSANGTDPDGDPLTYSWDFGDGSSGSGANPSHTYQNVGSYTAVVTTRDNRGGSSVCSVGISVTDGGGGGGCPGNSSWNITGSFTDIGAGGVAGTRRVRASIFLQGASQDDMSPHITTFYFMPGTPQNGQLVGQGVDWSWEGDVAVGDVIKSDLSVSCAGDTDNWHGITIGPYTVGSGKSLQKNSSKAEEDQPKERSVLAANINLVRKDFNPDGKTSGYIGAGVSIFNGPKVDIEPFLDLGLSQVLVNNHENGLSFGLNAEAQVWFDRTDARGGVQLTKEVKNPNAWVKSLRISTQAMLANAFAQYDEDHIYGTADDGDSEVGLTIGIGAKVWENPNPNAFVPDLGFKVQYNRVSGHDSLLVSLGTTF